MGVNVDSDNHNACQPQPGHVYDSSWSLPELLGRNTLSRQTTGSLDQNIPVM